ncbi:nitroreductase family protein [Clostridium sp. WLY-B-L2]|uniref:Nitroreductase family protein n=1 Tax=Clostridium aromativorans TaxID=2836848 RepID=A0ABS8NAN5_9CLOT|nr:MULTISPECIES: nitroreductase family protein [Clostridium]KAA8671536.1 nitroreductase family protein [Clostridium sp. HV4-5-A1G]MCC9296862.1 nitroreductase family protein [Clostridium aromativorans]
MESQVLETIRKRRSIRKYGKDQIPDEKLSLIIEAGRFAPSGGNNQTNHFIVIQNKETLQKLKLMVEKEFANMEIEEGIYKSIKNSILASKKGGYDFIYNAPTLIVAANQREYGNAMADCSVALENMMLAAVSLDIGSCWINQLHWLDDNKCIHGYLVELGLKENETICGGLALGYSQTPEMACLRRTGNVVTYVK